MKLPPRFLKALMWGGGVVAPALILWVLTLFVSPIGDYIQRVIDQWRNGDTNSQHISTLVPSCVTGFVPGLLAPEGQELPASLSDGADRTYICDNIYIEAEKEHFIEKLAQTYPGCFVFTTMIKPDLALIQDNAAVCRAAYRVSNGRAQPSHHDLGVNVCLGAKGRTYSRVYGPKNKQLPRQCSDEELDAEGFLQH